MLYLKISVWRHVDEHVAIRYFCLKRLRDEYYAVQSADYFRLPIDEKQMTFFDKQFVELFIEMSPDDRCEWFDSIEKAIGDHDKYFGNDREMNN